MIYQHAAAEADQKIADALEQRIGSIQPGRTAGSNLTSAVDAARWSMNMGFDVRERGLAWAEGVYLGGGVRAGQGSAGVSW